MWHLGIDLHRRTVVIEAVNGAGEVRPAVRFECSQPEKILHYCEDFGAFRCVNEATSTYRWLYKLLSPAGAVLLTRIRKRSSAKVRACRRHVNRRKSVGNDRDDGIENIPNSPPSDEDDGDTAARSSR